MNVKGHLMIQMVGIVIAGLVVLRQPPVEKLSVQLFASSLHLIMSGALYLLLLLRASITLQR
jgi:hypothetical protein